jgi:hypothetical protein
MAIQYTSCLSAEMNFKKVIYKVPAAELFFLHVVMLCVDLLCLYIVYLHENE